MSFCASSWEIGEEQEGTSFVYAESAGRPHEPGEEVENQYWLFCTEFCVFKRPLALFLPVLENFSNPQHYASSLYRRVGSTDS